MKYLTALNEHFHTLDGRLRVLAAVAVVTVVCTALFLALHHPSDVIPVTDSDTVLRTADPADSGDRSASGIVLPAVAERQLGTVPSAPSGGSGGGSGTRNDQRAAVSAEAELNAGLDLGVETSGGVHPNRSTDIAVSGKRLDNTANAFAECAARPVEIYSCLALIPSDITNDKLFTASRGIQLSVTTPQHVRLRIKVLGTTRCRSINDGVGCDEWAAN